MVVIMTTATTVTITPYNRKHHLFAYAHRDLYRIGSNNRRNQNTDRLNFSQAHGGRKDQAS